MPELTNRCCYVCGRPIPGPAEVERVLARVARCYGFTTDDLRGRSRHHQLVRPRLHAALLLREHGLSYPAIARALHRDHSAVLYAHRKAVTLVEGDVGFAAVADHLRARLVAEAAGGAGG